MPTSKTQFVEYVKKARIEVVAHDEMAEQIVQTIVRVAHTGNRGDGKVFVWPVEHAVRIKTGETARLPSDSKRRRYRASAIGADRELY